VAALGWPFFCWRGRHGTPGQPDPKGRPPKKRNIFYYFCGMLEKGLYILKIRGTAKIPDYVQIRDSRFTLMAYFRVDRPEKALKKCGLAEQEELIKTIIEKLPFGKMEKLDLTNL